jgi:hypothetical protein
VPIILMPSSLQGMNNWMSADGVELEERRPEPCAALKQMLSSSTRSHRTTTPTWLFTSGRRHRRRHHVAGAAHPSPALQA